jgi:hypothetical protein
MLYSRPDIGRAGVIRTFSLRAALKRGALVSAANWPVILIDFTIESFYKLALTIPVLGGALVVTALAGSDLGAVVDDGVRAAAETVLGALAATPIALFAFLAALALVGFGGALLMFAVKSGTLAVLVAGERAAGDIHAHPVRAERVRRASAYSLSAVYEGVRRFGRRALVLAVWFSLADLAIAVLYLGVMGYGFSLAVARAWVAAWPLLVGLSTTTGIVAVVAINLAYDLLRVIVITDDCSVSAAFRRLAWFVTGDARQVVGIFSVIGGVMVFATIGSILAAAGLAVVAWIPIVGLIVIPLQAAAWIVRGLVFQYMSLSALSAYQTQYRRFSEDQRPAALSALSPAGE